MNHATVSGAGARLSGVCGGASRASLTKSRPDEHFVRRTRSIRWDEEVKCYSLVSPLVARSFSSLSSWAVRCCGIPHGRLVAGHTRYNATRPNMCTGRLRGHPAGGPQRTASTKQTSARRVQGVSRAMSRSTQKSRLQLLADVPSHRRDVLTALFCCPHEQTLI
jgi:hypothetical protein